MGYGKFVPASEIITDGTPQKQFIRQNWILGDTQDINDFFNPQRSNEIADWIDAHIKGRWTNITPDVNNPDNMFEFALYFELKEDFTLYKLTWG